MASEQIIETIQHAVDNNVRSSDYSILTVLEAPSFFDKVVPEPCGILPRQFGYWFHTGPGFGALRNLTYGHKILTAENVQILGTDGVVVYKGGWVDTVSLNYARVERPGCQFHQEGATLFAQQPGRKLEGIFFLGYNAGHNNYAHWLTDQLPLLYYYKTEYATQGIKVLLPKKHHAFVAYYVQLLAIPPALIEYIDDEVVEVDTLLHPTFFSFDLIPKSAVNMLKDMISEYLPLPATNKRKIFVSRRDTPSRALLNEDYLVKIAEQAGFELIVPGTLPVEDQIAAFRDAEVVIASHGAGLANLTFCAPDTQIIELFPEYTVSSLFWLLASHFNLKYGAIFGTSFDKDMALSDQTGSWDAPYVIDEAVFRRCLKQ